MAKEGDTDHHAIGCLNDARECDSSRVALFVLDNDLNYFMEKQTKKRLFWILGTFFFGLFLGFLSIFLGAIMGFVAFLVMLVGPLLSLYLIKPSDKEKEVGQRLVQSEKKAPKWAWLILGGFVLLIIVSAMGGGEKTSQETVQPQVSQEEGSKETEVSPEVKKLIEGCKSETVKRYGSQGDKFFFCGCYCGLFAEYPDVFANCQNECLEWVFKGVFK